MEATAQSTSRGAAAMGYAASAFPEPYRILGLRLRPFSLGHYLLLQRFGCQYLADDASLTTREDLLLGVLICSLRHQEFLEFIEEKTFARELKKWGKKTGLFDFPSKSALFAQYLKASLTEPEYIAIQPGGEGGDWAQNLKMTLVIRLHYTEERALDMPLSQALADYYKLAESEGQLRLVTDEDRAQAATNDQALEQLAALNLQPSTLNPLPPCPA